MAAGTLTAILVNRLFRPQGGRGSTGHDSNHDNDVDNDNDNDDESNHDNLNSNLCVRSSSQPPLPTL